MHELKIKDLGIIYTPKKITRYLCEHTIFSYIFDRLNESYRTSIEYKGNFKLILNQLEKEQLVFALKITKKITCLDPAVGIGHFLLVVLLTLEKLYIYFRSKKLCDWNDFQIREWIVTHNLYGVDISEAAAEECKSRLLAAVLEKKDELDKQKTFQDLTFNIKTGNSLIGSIPGHNHRELTKQNSIKPFHWEKEFPQIFETKGFDICLTNPPWNILKPVEKEFFSQFDSRLTKYGVDKSKSKEIINSLLKQENIKKRWNEYKDDIRFSANYFRKNEYNFQSAYIKGFNKIKKVSGDLNLYKLFLERIFNLINTQGYCGVIIPSGFHTDAGTKGLRKLLFDENEVIKLYSFENRQGIFPSIHRSFKFDLLIFKRIKSINKKFRAAFMLHDIDILKKIDEKALTIDWNIIKRLSPSSWSVLEFKAKRDVAIAKKMYNYPTLREKGTGSWEIQFTRELDMSLDSSLFNKKQRGLIIFEGKMIEQYNPNFKEPRYWIDENNIQKKFSEHYRDFKEFRLGFRAVAASTNRRTMIASIIPKNVCCGNSIILTKIFDTETNKRLIEEKDLLYICGVFNSFVFDFLLRLKVTTNINMFFIYDMPVPRLTKDNKTYQRIVRNVARLYPEFNELNKRLTKKTREKHTISKIQLKAETDSLVTRLYGLNKENLKYILDQFHQKDPRKEEEMSILKESILNHF
ncbi:MAG: Eco57I restriction-modification methylase domain-containing protein [Candidatus Hodarchaeales archaeon]